MMAHDAVLPLLSRYYGVVEKAHDVLRPTREAQHLGVWQAICDAGCGNAASNKVDNGVAVLFPRRSHGRVGHVRGKY